MKIKDVFDFLNTIAPFDSCFEWDNCGLLVGDINADFHKALICLDVTDDIIDECASKQCNLIISHHPVIFDKLGKITSDLLVFKLIKNNINVISFHTNLDIAETGVNFVLANVLNLQDLCCLKNDRSEHIGLMGKLDQPLSSLELAKFVKEKLKCKKTRYLNTNKQVKTVAVCGGAGSSFFNDVAKQCADAFITSEIKHNIWIDALRQNITLVDAGHFYTENVICDDLTRRLNSHFKSNDFQTAENNKDITDIV